MVLVRAVVARWFVAPQRVVTGGASLDAGGCRAALVHACKIQHALAVALRIWQRMVMPDGAAAKTYWAAETDSTKAVDGVLERIRRYREWLRITGRLERMKRNWRAYAGYGPNGDKNSAATRFAGERGELLSVNVNQFATLANQTVVLTTSSKPAMKAIAGNADFSSQAQCQLTDAILDAYDRELSLDELEVQATKDMVLASETWGVLEWDVNAGQAFSVDENNQEVRNGDAVVRILTPFDVAYDTKLLDERQRKWVAYRYHASRWDLAAQHPSLADKLSGQTQSEPDTIFDSAFEWREESWAPRPVEGDEDVVTVWEFRHVPTPALPKGRIIRFVSSACVLFDTVEQKPDGTVADYGYPFKGELFAYQAFPERQTGSKEPHTSFFDTLSMQEGLDLGATILASSVNAGGLQNLMVPATANVAVDQQPGGLNIIKYEGAVAPDWGPQLNISPAVMEWADRCVSWMRQRVGSNDVVSGQTTKGMPAQLAALLRAEAVEFHSSLARGYERFVQRLRTGLVKLLQKYATSQRTSMIVGKANSWAIREWSAADIKDVESVQVEPVNPVMKTYAGRISLAESMLDRGITIGSPASAQFVALVTTGRMEPLLSDESDNMKRIQQTKEMLMRGVGLPPIMTGPNGMPVVDASGLPQFAKVQGEFVRPLRYDTHHIDLKEWRSVLSMPFVRENEAVVNAVHGVIQYQRQLWASLDMDELAALNIPPLPSQQMMLGGTPPPTPGETTGTPPPAPGETSDSGPQPSDIVADATPDAATQASAIKQPQPPPNPLAPLSPV